MTSIVCIRLEQLAYASKYADLLCIFMILTTFSSESDDKSVICLEKINRQSFIFNYQTKILDGATTHENGLSIGDLSVMMIYFSQRINNCDYQTF